MKQQINLYQPVQKAPRKPFNGRTSLMVVVLCTLLMLLLSYLNQNQLSQQQARVDQLKQERQQLQQEFEQSRQNRESVAVDESLQVQLSNLENQLASTRQRHQALAPIRQQPKHTWARLLSETLQAQDNYTRISNLQLDNQQHSLSIQGSTQQPEQLSDYLSSLSQLVNFKGLYIEQLLMEKQGRHHEFRALLSLSAGGQP